MSHAFRILPPPDLSYPPDGPDLDRPVPTHESNYERPQLAEKDKFTEPQVSDQELTSFLTVVGRLIQDKGGRHVCTMCGYVQNILSLGSLLKTRLLSDILEVPSEVGVNDLEALFGHLKQAHPLS